MFKLASRKPALTSSTGTGDGRGETPSIGNASLVEAVTIQKYLIQYECCNRCRYQYTLTLSGPHGVS